MNRRDGRKREFSRWRRTHMSDYRLWLNVRSRCESPADKDWKHYGARGVRVCERWQSFDNFLADMGPRPPGMTLERIDNDKGYEPGNCRWATREEQMANRSNTKRVEHNGRMVSASEIAKATGIKRNLVTQRIAIGWSYEKVVSTPARERQKERL